MVKFFETFTVNAEFFALVDEINFILSYAKINAVEIISCEFCRKRWQKCYLQEMVHVLVMA